MSSSILHNLRLKPDQYIKYKMSYGPFNPMLSLNGVPPAGPNEAKNPANPSEAEETVEENEPNQTLYLNRLNEKVPIDELRDALHVLFSQHGEV